MIAFMLMLVGCAAPWTLGAEPLEVPVQTKASTAPEKDLHTVKNPALENLGPALDRFSQAYVAAGSPTLGLLVLDSNEAAFETWRMTMMGMGLSGVDSASLSGGEPLPALPMSGWKEEAANQLQQILVGAEVRVVDFPVAQWAKAEGGASSTLPVQLVLELRYVESKPSPKAQIRLISMARGEVLGVERVVVTGRDWRSFGRGATRALAATLDSTAGRI